MSIKSIAELQAKQAKELAELQAQHAIAAELPAEPASIQAWAATGEPWVNFKVPGIAGAIDLMRKFVVVPFAEYRNGTLALKPLEECPEAFKAEECAPYAVQIKVDQSVGSFGPTGQVSFFARLPVAGLVRINAGIEGPGYIGTFQALSADYETYQGRLKQSSPIRPNAILASVADKRIKWAGGSAENISYSYLLAADHYDVDQPGEELSHALGILQNLADELDGGR